MAVPPYREKLVPFLESSGTLEVRRLRLQNHFHSEDWQAVDRWLSVKDAEGKARADERAEEALSISRMALRNSAWAKWIAIVAMIVAIIANHSQISGFLGQWFSR